MADEMILNDHNLENMLKWLSSTFYKELSLPVPAFHSVLLPL
jgi:hypothetical protein